MRGPEGPVRGGVTRCGRPPPRLRGRGRGNTSRLSILSKSCLPWTIVSACRLSSTMFTTSVSTLSSTVLRCTSGAFGRKLLPRNVGRLPSSQFVHRLIKFSATSRDRGIFATTMATRGKTVSSGKEGSGGKDLCRLVTRIEQTDRKSVWQRSSCSSDCCADIGALVERRHLLVARNTAREQSGPGTARCAVSRTDHPRLSRLITACHTPRRQLERCDTCHRLRRHRGAASSWRIPCHPRVLRSHRNRTRVCRGPNGLTSRG